MNKRLNFLYVIPLALSLIAFLITADALYTAVAFLIGLGILYLIRPRLLPPHVNRAANLFRTGRLEEALLVADQAIASRPESWEGYYVRSLTNLDLNKLVDAEVDARKAVDLKPDEATNHVVLGKTLYWQARYNDAQPAFESAADLNKRDPLNHFWLGATLFHNGDYLKAIPRLELATALKMNNPQLELLAYYYLGTALEAEGKHEDAQLPFRMMARLDKAFTSLEGDVLHAPDSPALPRLRKDVQAISRRLQQMETAGK